MFKISKKTICQLLVIVLLVLSVEPIFRATIYLDNKYLDEKVRFLYGRYIQREDWVNLPVLPEGMDYSWTYTGEKKLRIAHALGFSGTLLSNELDAIPIIRKLNLNVLEVDLWLDEDNSVRCYHGPGDPGPLLDNTCTLERLLHLTDAGGEYVILDIKTSFVHTVMAVDALLQKNPSYRRRIIFQLYKPDDVKVFAELPYVEDYAGPIISAYKSRSSLNAMIQGVRRSGIHAFTFPIKRQSAIDRSAVEGVRLYVHPVHDCIDWRDAESKGYDGVYTLALLKC